MEKAGFIGLGIMGKPMAKHLVKAGFDLLVNDLNEEAVKELAACGAKAAGLKEIGESCDIIFLCLPSGAVSKAVLFGQDGVASGLSAGKLVCDHSSVTPDESVYCHDELAKLGAGFVDAPISGGEPGAIAASLAIMCGGSEEDFRRLLPYFGAIGRSAVLIGGPGSGSVTKLANQIIVNMNIAAVSEALVLAEKCGADPEKVYKAIKGGLAGSAVLDAKAPMMYERNFKAGGKISINHKDLKNVMNTAIANSVPLPMTAELYQVYQTMMVNGHQDEDHSAIVKYFEKLAGVEVKRAKEE